MTLSAAQMTQVRRSTAKWIAQAENIYNKKLADIEVRFDLRGRTSGMFCHRNKISFIRYNSAIFARHFDESLAQTVPHEVAHYVVFECFAKRAKPHGEEWKSVMRAFEVPAAVTCKLDLSGLPQRTFKRFPYKCACATHQLTSIRHNRIIQGIRQYGCPKCHQPLVAEEADNVYPTVGMN